LGLFFFSNSLLQLVGGQEYASSIATQQQIVYVIILYILILPLDRYSGVALFALNLPKQNLKKIIIMLFSNVIFDIIAIFVFESLFLVSLATFSFTLVGIIIGWYYISKNDLPWAINLPVSFTYPIEKKSILNGHIQFNNWASSNGENYKDWYQNKAGYRNNDKLYTK